MLFLLAGAIKFLVDREWGFAAFCGAFVALGVYYSSRDMRRKQARTQQTPPDPAAPIHPE